MAENKYLYLKVKDSLIEMINGMNPYDRIPPREILIKQFNVTRTTVDRAISELVGEGYLYSKGGSGTYVAQKNTGNVRSDSNIPSIGLVIPNITSYNYPGILRGVEDIAYKDGYNVIICNTDNQVAKQQAYIEKLISTNVKGLIIVPIILGIEIESYKKLKENNIPFVFCNRAVEGVEAPLITYNNFYGAYIATRHMIENGCKRIAFLSRSMQSVIKERLHGYMAALADNGCEYDKNLAFFEEYREDDNYGNIGIRYLMEKGSFDGILCTDDGIAYNAVNYVLENGYKVPEDISFVGFDNSELCEKSPVKLTSINYNSHEIGSNAAATLIDGASGREAVTTNRIATSMPTLVIRDSSRK